MAGWTIFKRLGSRSKRRPNIVSCTVCKYFICRRYHYQRSAAESKDLLDAHGLRAGRDIQRAVPEITWMGRYLRSHPIGCCRIYTFPHVLFVTQIFSSRTNIYIHVVVHRRREIFCFVIENKLWEVISAFTINIVFSHCRIVQCKCL